MVKPVDLNGPKGPFVHYLFYGDHSKNIEHHFGNEMGIEIKKEINSIADIEISQLVLDVDTEFSTIDENELKNVFNLLRYIYTGTNLFRNFGNIDTNVTFGKMSIGKMSKHRSWTFFRNRYP